MNPFRLAALTAAVLAIGLGAPAWAQHEGHDHSGHDHSGHGHEAHGQDEAKMMEIMEKYMVPADQHKMLEPLAGSFTYQSSFWMMPDTDPMTDTGTAQASWVHGGRYLKQEHKGTAMGQPFSGTGYLGFDRYNEEYFSFWIDNMGTGFMTSNGKASDDGSKIVLEGTFDNFWDGVDDQWNKSVFHIDGPGSHRLEMFMEAPDGTPFKHMEIVYKRADRAEK